MSNEIKLVQHPVIQHKLKEAGEKVSKRIEDLDIEKQIVTLDSLRPLKNLRTELNKELANFENQRKFIKKSVNKPYLEFENTYKSEISEKYKKASSTLKDKIDFFESKLKTEKQESIEEYFNELCVSEQINFISFDKIGININLSTSEKKYKEQVYDYITKVNDDLALIKSTDFEAEILTEYKSSLNASKAITSVKTRKEKEAKEKARLKAETTQNRKNYLEKIGMHFVEITNAYEFNDDVYITNNEIENLSKEDFTAKYSEFEVKIKELKAKELAEIEASKPKEVQKETEPITKQEVKKPIAKPISAPIVEKPKEPIKTASFEVKATMPQLRALGEYMKQNNITYKNI